MRKRMNRREALKAAAGGVLSIALPSGGADTTEGQAGRDEGGMGFVSDTGERFHLVGDGWAMALGIADHRGWRLDPWPLSGEHQRRTAEVLAARAREVELLEVLRDSDEAFADVDDEELDLADYREEVRHCFFSPAKAGALAVALQAALNDPGFENLVAAFREPGRCIMEKSIAASSGHARRVLSAMMEQLECKDLRGRLEAFVAFCHKGGFRLDVID